MQSRAKTVSEYIRELAPDRRAAVETVRRVILDNVGPEVEEGMQYGMIGFYIPHRVYPAGYHCDPKQPLPFICLASQKNHLSLYLMTIYGSGEHESWFRGQWAKSGKKLDMGKCCIRFRSADDLALPVIAEAIRRVPVRLHIETYENAVGRSSSGGTKGRTRAASAKPAAKKSLTRATAGTAKTAKAARPTAKSGKSAARPAAKKAPPRGTSKSQPAGRNPIKKSRPKTK